MVLNTELSHPNSASHGAHREGGTKQKTLVLYELKNVMPPCRIGQPAKQPRTEHGDCRGGGGGLHPKPENFHHRTYPTAYIQGLPTMYYECDTRISGLRLPKKETSGLCRSLNKRQTAGAASGKEKEKEKEQRPRAHRQEQPINSELLCYSCRR